MPSVGEDTRSAGRVGTTTGLEARFTATAGTCQLEVALSAGAGEVVAVVGPNGAGKTTLLRVLAGLHPIEAGTVTLDGTELAGLAPQDRPVGMVFQDHRLFPHLSALDNVAFGLRAQGMPRAAARHRALDWLSRLAVADAASKRPGALSGGQAQRVALARALAPEPGLLLLDEPLSALDAGTLPLVRELVRHRPAAPPGVGVLVTHDPLQAMALASRLVVLEGGRVTQAGSVADIARRPRSAYVADLVGLNLFPGTARPGGVVLADGATLVTATDPTAAGSGGEQPAAVFALVHPRAVSLHRRQPEGSPRNVWLGRVSGAIEPSPDAADDRVRVRIEGPIPLVAEITAGAARDLALGDGLAVWVSVKASEVVVYPA